MNNNNNKMDNNNNKSNRELYIYTHTQRIRGADTNGVYIDFLSAFPARESLQSSNSLFNLCPFCWLILLYYTIFIFLAYFHMSVCIRLSVCLTVYVCLSVCLPAPFIDYID